MKIISVVGARPQFIKAAQLSKAIVKSGHIEKIIHTGQHYDNNMSSYFFIQLDMPFPDYNLNVGSASDGEQTALMLSRIEKVLQKEKPRVVIVYGDTNSTLAGALAACKLHIPVAHVEAGVRCYKRDMPEEINRVLTDHTAEILFCPTQTAVENLRREGIEKHVYLVGDIMYESMINHIELARKRSNILSEICVTPQRYYLATIHRAENTGSYNSMREIMDALISLDLPVVFPIHPRAKKMLNKFKLQVDDKAQLKIVPPVTYFDMLILEENAKAILTDSGGVQREAWLLHKPCLILRSETEWVETIEGNGAILVGSNKWKIIGTIKHLENFKAKKGKRNVYGDGNTSEKIVRTLSKIITR